MSKFSLCEDCLFACRFDYPSLTLSCELVENGLPESVYACEQCVVSGCAFGGPYKKSALKKTLRDLLSLKYNIPASDEDDFE